MKAVVHRSYGSPEVLKIEEIEKPVPQDNQVLVKIHASSVNPAQWYAMVGLWVGRLGNGLFKPKETRFGVDYAGVVEAVGKNVTQFKPGDAVYGGRRGAFAEYLCVDEIVIPKPENLSFEEAGGVATAAITALQALRDHGQVQPGQKVLINGAAGGVGTFAVQLAKSFGAEVTAVCSARNVDMVRSLGADRVIDYTKEDFTRSDIQYDLFLDIAGSRAFKECQRVLKPEARFIIVGAPKSNLLLGPLTHVLKIKLAARRASQQVIFFIANFKREDFLMLNDLFASGKVKTVIDRIYPLREISEAMRYLGAGHARGKIIIKV